jgi:hypothetical protein
MSEHGLVGGDDMALPGNRPLNDSLSDAARAADQLDDHIGVGLFDHLGGVCKEGRLAEIYSAFKRRGSDQLNPPPTTSSNQIRLLGQEPNYAAADGS